jgi:hypothetical protein
MPRVFQESDIAAMMADWGNTIIVDGVMKPCLFEERDEEDQALEGPGQIKRVCIAQVRSSDFAEIAQDDEVEVDGDKFTVYRKTLLGDGGITELYLRKAA